MVGAARVAVRVNPDFELKSSGMKMAGGPKQFGVDAEQVPELLAAIGREPDSPLKVSTSLPARRTCARSHRRSATQEL
jgi:diaminopimelate decarboxylase